MQKLMMPVMLGLSLLFGAAGTFADDSRDTTKKEGKVAPMDKTTRHKRTHHHGRKKTTAQDTATPSGKDTVKKDTTKKE